MIGRRNETQRGRLLAILRLQYPDALADEGFKLLHPVSGDPYTAEKRHLVATCRSIANFGMGAIADGPDWCLDAVRHGLTFLREYHLDAGDGGYHLLVNADSGSVDSTRSAYGHAFVLLACARAVQAGVSDARRDLEAVENLIDDQFRDKYGLIRSDCTPDWDELEAYRGQNANMHACEAYIAAYEATDVRRYLERARHIAGTLTVEFAKETEGLIWEHYTDEWAHDFGYNRDAPSHQFRPPGYQPGHHVEWAKLLALLDRYESDPATRPEAMDTDESWYSRAEELFSAAIDLGWTGDGFAYTVEADGEIIVPDRYGWAIAEGLGAAAALTERAEEREEKQAAQRFDDWANRFLSLTDAYRGPAGPWYEKRIAEDVGGDPIPPEPPGVEPDYHPAGAYFESWRSSR